MDNVLRQMTATGQLPRHGAFVIVWQLSRTPADAADALGRRVEKVVKQADYLRSKGVPLKSTPALTSESAAKHSSFVAQLTADQRHLFWKHMQNAVRGAYVAAEKFGDIGLQAIAIGVLDDIAFENWAKQLATGKVDATKNPASFAYGAGRYAAMHYFRKAPDSAMYVESEPEAAEPVETNTVDEAELASRAAALRQALAATGGKVPTDHEGWVRLGLSLGLSRRAVYSASRAGIQQLVTEALREKLNDRPQPPPEAVTAPPVPEPIRRRMSMAPVLNDQQHEAERFIRAWYDSSTALGASKMLGWSLSKTTKFAKRLRLLGIPLKSMSTSPAPMVRGVLALRPSLN